MFISGTSHWLIKLLTHVDNVGSKIYKLFLNGTEKISDRFLVYIQINSLVLSWLFPSRFPIPKELYIHFHIRQRREDLHGTNSSANTETPRPIVIELRPSGVRFALSN